MKSLCREISECCWNKCKALTYSKYPNWTGPLCCPQSINLWIDMTVMPSVTHQICLPRSLMSVCYLIIKAIIYFEFSHQQQLIKLISCRILSPAYYKVSRTRSNIKQESLKNLEEQLNTIYFTCFEHLERWEHKRHGTYGCHWAVSTFTQSSDPACLMVCSSCFAISAITPFKLIVLPSYLWYLSFTKSYKPFKILNRLIFNTHQNVCSIFNSHRILISPLAN